MVTRCYRCLELTLTGSMTPVVAPCGCQHHYCEICVRSPRLLGFLDFIASRCTRWSIAA